MKKWEKIIFYEHNISFALIFRKWKLVSNNLTRHTKLILICNIQYIYIYYIILHLKVFYIFRKFHKLKASVLQYTIK